MEEDAPVMMNANTIVSREQDKQKQAKLIRSWR